MSRRFSPDPERYRDKPRLRLLELYLLWVIGRLPEEQAARLEKMAPRLAVTLGGDGSWQDAVVTGLEIPPDFTRWLPEAWSEHLAGWALHGRELDPQEFAEQVVDANFPSIAGHGAGHEQAVPKAEKKFKLAASQMLSVAPGRGACFATDRITVDGELVGYMYREAPDRENDSGWRFLAGDESAAYMDDPARHGVYDVNTIANYDPDIIPFLDAGRGAHFVRDEDGKFEWFDIHKLDDREPDADAETVDYLERRAREGGSNWRWKMEIAMTLLILTMVIGGALVLWLTPGVFG